MPLVLKKAEWIGMHSVMYFRTPKGAVHRVVVSQEDYDGIKSDLNPGVEFRTKSNLSIRPAPAAKLYKAQTMAQFDRPNGFLEEGDCYEHDGQLIIQLPITLTSIPVLVFAPEEWTGRLNDIGSVNASGLVGGVLNRVVDGVLL